MKRTKTPKNQVEHTDNFDKKSHIEKAGMKLTDDELEMVSGGMNGVGGIDMGSLFRNATSGLEMDGQALHTKIDGLTSKDGVDRELLEMQFAMGQYNAKLESMSSVTRRLQEIHRELTNG